MRACALLRGLFIFASKTFPFMERINKTFSLKFWERYCMLENRFKTLLVRELKALFPGCIIIHPDPDEIQGIPDLIILYKDKWAALEGKRSAISTHRPNQDYYVELMKDMSYAAFI